jgi:hypothetical protein
MAGMDEYANACDFKNKKNFEVSIPGLQYIQREYTLQLIETNIIVSVNKLDGFYSTDG